MTQNGHSDAISLRDAMLRFVAVGILNTALTLGTIVALKALADVGDVPANAAGYGVGLAVSFLLNRNWTFRHQGPVLPTMMRFGVSVIVAYACNLATVLGLIGIGVNEYTSHIAGMPVYTAVFFVAARVFVFARPSSQSGVQEQAKTPHCQISSSEQA